MSDPNPPTSPHVDERLRAAPIAWFGTTRADGQPHLVPVWFLWDGEAVLVFTKPESRKARHLRANPRATLALDGAEDGEVVIVEGEAELLAEPTAAVVGPAYWEKYAELMRRDGWTRDGVVAEYTQPIRVRPTKILAW